MNVRERINECRARKRRRRLAESMTRRKIARKRRLHENEGVGDVCLSMTPEQLASLKELLELVTAVAVPDEDDEAEDVDVDVESGFDYE